MIPRNKARTSRYGQPGRLRQLPRPLEHFGLLRRVHDRHAEAPLHVSGVPGDLHPLREQVNDFPVDSLDVLAKTREHLQRSPRLSAVMLGDRELAADRGGEYRNLPHQLVERVRCQGLDSVGASLLRIGVDLDEQPVGAGGDRGQGQRGDEVGPARCVTRIDENREVRLRLEHRDRRDVEREPG